MKKRKKFHVMPLREKPLWWVSIKDNYEQNDVAALTTGNVLFLRQCLSAG